MLLPNKITKNVNNLVKQCAALSLSSNLFQPNMVKSKSENKACKYYK